LFDKAFRGGIIGKEYICLESATSTNDAAMDLGKQREDPEGIIVIAETQSRGRGRLGRDWISPPGVNLYFTVLLKPPFHPNEANFITLMTAVAVVTAIREYTGADAKIKWPNDIMVNGKKAGGVLVEMKSGGDRIKFLCIGIGLNVNMPLDALPDDIRLLSTSLMQETGQLLDRVKVFGAILLEMEKSYKILLSGDKRAIIHQWIRLNCTVGHEIAARAGERIISGMAEGISDKGELIIRAASGKVETLSSGEVTIRN